MDIVDIWKIDNKAIFLIAMNSCISKKCNYGENITKLSSQERIFYVVMQLEAEVNNGGFSQYFYNSSGDWSNEVVKSYRAIGAIKVADICKKAITSFGADIPPNRDVREIFLNQFMNDEVNRILDECDNEFYEYSEDLLNLNYQFIIKNKDSFNYTKSV